jgi:hypothetical protein
MPNSLIPTNEFDCKVDSLIYLFNFSIIALVFINFFSELFIQNCLFIENDCNGCFIFSGFLIICFEKLFLLVKILLNYFYDFKFVLLCIFLDTIECLKLFVRLFIYFGNIIMVDEN